jgi:hypothetical protein
LLEVPLNWVTCVRNAQLYGKNGIDTTISFFLLNIKVFFLPMNTDASFKESSRIGGWSTVCRDAHGDLRFADAGSMVNVVDAFHAKTLALSKAVDLLGNLGVGFA